MTTPRLWTQLATGSGTEGSDCGALAVINVAYRLSDGKVGPDVQKPAREPQSVANWVKQVRRIAGNPRGPMLVYGDIYEALSSRWLAQAFRAQNLKPLRVDYRYGMPFGDLRKWLEEPGRMAILPHVYGVAREDGAPMGSMTFDGAHVSTFHGARRKRVKVGRRYVHRWFTTVGDPLMDGRRKPGSTSRYPRGYLSTRLYRWRRAAGAFGTGPDGKPRPIGHGRVVAILCEKG